MFAILSGPARLLAQAAELTIGSHPGVLLHRRPWDRGPERPRPGDGRVPPHLRDDLGLADTAGNGTDAAGRR